MSKGFVFWLIMLLLILATGYAAWPLNNMRPFAPSLIEFILFGLLGWHCFGAPIKG
jgi:hypothetical protein